jgi:ATP-dependent Clp protease ATP-binding subunit ClpA
MYERFTHRARKVLQLADQEAQRLNHEYIDTEHILLGLVKEGDGSAVRILNNLGIDLRKVLLELKKWIQPGPETIFMGKPAQTPRAKKVIERAIEESCNLNHADYVGTEHLLLGLMREQEGVAFQVLWILGLRLELVREEIRAPGGHRQVSRPAPPNYVDTRAWPADVRRTLQELHARIKGLTRDKEAAAAAYDFERAALLRDEADKLKKQLQQLIRDVQGGRMQEQGGRMYEYDLFVPLRYNDGAPVAADHLARVRQRLVEQFGGLTDLHQRHEGYWKIGGVTFRDEIVIYRALADDAAAARQFFRQLKEELKADLHQADVLIVEREVEVL